MVWAVGVIMGKLALVDPSVLLEKQCSPRQHSLSPKPYGRFHKLRVLFVGVLIKRALLICDLYW